MDASRVQQLLGSASVHSKPGTRNEKGTGLGLLLVKQYLAAAGGKLEIVSTPGAGSTFTAVLPTS
jgi:signal transduction histidine kinase